jgi:hypothetical protein
MLINEFSSDSRSISFLFLRFFKNVIQITASILNISSMQVRRLAKNRTNHLLISNPAPWHPPALPPGVESAYSRLARRAA